MFVSLPQSDPMDFLASHRTNSSSESKFFDESRLQQQQHSNPGTTSSHGSHQQRKIPNWSDILPPPPPPDQPPPPGSPNNAAKHLYNFRRQSSQQVKNQNTFLIQKLICPFQFVHYINLVYSNILDFPLCKLYSNHTLISVYSLPDPEVWHIHNFLESICAT